MTYERALILTNDSISQGHILPEQEDCSYMYRVREALEKVEELEKQNEQLKNAAFNVCAEYKGCEGCHLHDAKEYKCKLLDSYPEPKEAIHEYIQRIYRR